MAKKKSQKLVTVHINIYEKGDERQIGKYKFVLSQDDAVEKLKVWIDND